MRAPRLTTLALVAVLPVAPQVIEFESGGLRYLTQTRNGVTVMFAHLPLQVREYAVLQVAISNGSSKTWTIRPGDFRFRKQDGSVVTGVAAGNVVNEFMKHAGRDDVVKLVTQYEAGLYGLRHVRAAGGYESRRQNYIAEVENPKLKAAAAASAIVLASTRLRSGESTDGAVFYANAGKPLGQGTLLVDAAGTVFEFAMR